MKNRSSPGQWPRPRPLARRAEPCCSLREGQGVTSGRKELPDICVPRVFHKPGQLLSIVSGEDGLLSLYHPITFPGNNSCPGGNLVPHTQQLLSIIIYTYIMQCIHEMCMIHTQLHKISSLLPTVASAWNSSPPHCSHSLLIRAKSFIKSEFKFHFLRGALYNPPL